MRAIRARAIRQRVMEYMTRNKINMRLFKFNYRRVKKAYNRGEYAI